MLRRFWEKRTYVCIEQSCTRLNDTAHFLTRVCCAVVSVVLHATAASPQVRGLARASNADRRSSQRNMWPRGVLALGGAGDAEDVDVEVIRTLLGLCRRVFLAG